MTEIRLPRAVVELHRASLAVKEHFAHTGLAFTLDGKIVGDIAEALAAEIFDLTLCANRTPGVDGHAPDGRTVQIKATGKPRAGPAFTPGEGIADHLIFLRLNFSTASAEIAYNGPEAPIRRMLPAQWRGTKRASLAGVIEADAGVLDRERLQRVR